MENEYSMKEKMRFGQHFNDIRAEYRVHIKNGETQTTSARKAFYAKLFR